MGKLKKLLLCYCCYNSNNVNELFVTPKNGIKNSQMEKQIYTK